MNSVQNIYICGDRPANDSQGDLNRNQGICMQAKGDFSDRVHNVYMFLGRLDHMSQRQLKRTIRLESTQIRWFWGWPGGAGRLDHKNGSQKTLKN